MEEYHKSIGESKYVEGWLCLLYQSFEIRDEILELRSRWLARLFQGFKGALDLIRRKLFFCMFNLF
jgi:hypothetical protein